MTKLKALAGNPINTIQFEIHSRKNRKPCGKWRKYWLPASSHFPTMFQKHFHQDHEIWDCLVKGSHFTEQENFVP